MIDSSVLSVNERTELGLFLLGIALVTAAAYYAGQTGDWEPLIVTSIALSLLVVFVTSDRCSTGSAPSFDSRSNDRVWGE